MELIDKHRLLETAPHPKAVIVGGSFAAFGVDSVKIRAQTKYFPVNMGLQAWFGIKYQLAEVKPYLKSGDIVFIIPEYENFFGKNLYGNEALAGLLFEYPQFRKYLDWDQWHNFIINFPMVIRNIIVDGLKHKFSMWRHGYTGENMETKALYCRSSFNLYGDMIAHLGKPSQKVDANNIVGDYNPETKAIINRFILDCKKKGITCYLKYPIMRESQGNLNINKLIDNRIDLYMYPDDMFYDSVYHLRDEGRRLFTDSLVRIINE